MNSDIEVNDIDFQLLEEDWFDFYSDFRENNDELDAELNHVTRLIQMLYKKFNYKEDSYSIFLKKEKEYSDRCFTEDFSRAFIDYTWLFSTRKYYNRLVIESHKPDSDFLKMPVERQLEMTAYLDDQELNKVKEWLKLTGTSVMREW